MTDRICGGHCPIEHISDSTTINCRKCGSSFHLPCYDVIVPKAKLFVSSNIVFICDACLIDIGKSPKRKGPTAVNLKQSVLAPKSNGNVGFLSPQGTPTTSKVTSKASNEQLITMMASMQKKLDEHTKKLDKIDEHVDGTKDGMVKLHQMQSDVFNFVTSRSAFSGAPQVMAHERFRPHTAQNKANESKTPKVNDKQFGANIRTYSTVVQTKLPVTPFSETPRKRETTISLIHNATGQTVQSMKFPTPKQGKKDVQIGRPVEELQRPVRNVNTMSKAIFVSPFHPETTIEEVTNYIVTHTDAKEETKFKCTKLVKKDADITKMKSVSFKIDVTPEVYDILIAPDNWPKNKRIREFIKMSPPKSTLNDFMPQHKTTTNASVSNETHSGSNSSISSGSDSGSGSSSSSNSTNNNSSNVTINLSSQQKN